MDAVIRQESVCNGPSPINSKRLHVCAVKSQFSMRARVCAFMYRTLRVLVRTVIVNSGTQGNRVGSGVTQCARGACIRHTFGWD